MNYDHFIFSLLNIAGFIAVGALLAYFIKRDWEKLKSVGTRKFVIVAAIAALLGGMLGVLVNGTADLSMMVRNLGISSVFALITIAPYAFNNKIKV